ncbi:MAG: PGPGW domain-containing protein [Nanobdellota archaeon]
MRAIKILRRIGTTAIGITLILFGMILIVTPGPAIIVIPLGIMVLASEYVIVRRCIRRLQQGLERNGKKNFISKYLDEALRRLEK